MVVSPHNQTPVEGMANIARYLCREYFPALYEETKGGVTTASLIDSWLDMFSVSLQRGSAKEKPSVVRKLNAQLGSSQFLTGDEGPSLADIMGYCALCEQQQQGAGGLKLGGNVKQWLKRVREVVPGLANMPCPYLLTDSTS